MQESLRESRRDPGGRSEGIKWEGGGDGKLCVYVRQEEALRAGGNTRVSISGEGCMSWRVCVDVCVLFVIVTGGVYFGSAHRLTANKSHKIPQGGGGGSEGRRVQGK